MAAGFTHQLARVPWRVRGIMDGRTYLHRMRLAAWAFGANGMLPPSYTRRPGRNVWRHAWIRRDHFDYARDVLAFTRSQHEARWAADIAARNADWGLTR